MLTNLLGYKIAHLPIKYSGLPLGAHFKARNPWDSILERMEKRFSGWKKLYLSRGGRLT